MYWLIIYFAADAEHPKKRKICQDKLHKWASGKVTLTEIQEEALREEIKIKNEINQVRLQREKDISDLLKEDIRSRIQCNLDKNKAELELIAMQKARLL